jgi:hypothetical protein
MFPAGRHHGCDANLLVKIVKGDHLSTMVTKFGSNWSIDFRGEGHCDVKITPEMFRNNNFVNKDGQNISFGRMHLNVGLGEYNIHFPCIREI